MKLTKIEVINAIKRNALAESLIQKDTKVYALYLQGSFAGLPVANKQVIDILLRRGYSILAVYLNGREFK